LIDLDDELPEVEEGKPALPDAGRWRSVKSLDQFWEMMSFRQECSAGRLVGFLWLVINPPGLMNSTSMESQTRASSENGAYNATDAPVDTEEIKAETFDSAKEEGDKTQGTTTFSPSKTSSQPPRIDTINPFDWPEIGRGSVVLSEAGYKKMMDTVLDNFYDENEIVDSTKAYIDQVATLADELTWGKKVVGISETNTTQPMDNASVSGSASNILDLGVIRKRKKSLGEAAAVESLEPRAGDVAAPEPAAVNVLNASLVRKKKKT
jgi:regulator of Ty1 transposition protein 109